MVLESSLYVVSSLCSLCGFNKFGVRAVFSMDTCSLFSQLVLGVIPLIGCMQMWWLVPGPGVLSSGSGSDSPSGHVMGVDATHNHSWSSGGQWWGP